MTSTLGYSDVTCLWPTENKLWHHPIFIMRCKTSLALIYASKEVISVPTLLLLPGEGNIVLFKSSTLCELPWNELHFWPTAKNAKEKIYTGG